MADSRGNTVYPETSNRAGFFSDGVTDSTLLATTVSKSVPVVDTDGNVAIGSRCVIRNNSSQTAEITLKVAKAGYKRPAVSGDTGQGVGKIEIEVVEVAKNPLRLLTGESIELFERVVGFTEKNIGGGSQTGLGVQYFVDLEPRHR